MKVTTNAFDPGAAIRSRYTCDGDDLSPELRWSEVPDGTRSFALIMDDPDAPPGTWVHWVLYNVPGKARMLKEGLPKEERLDDGALQGACWGVDRFNRVGYYGPCPPPGAPHRYYFKLYALDTVLDLAPRATKDAVLASTRDHVLAEAQVMGTYGR
jgi:Raf kinase inhibitor-like YbhB/YbcL family protein